jgi:hypothetical protein
MAASALGGNVELSQPDQTIVTDNGVTIIAPTNLPATMPAGASAFYARNISSLLLHLVKDGALNLDLTDEITGAVVITQGGSVVQEATAKLLGVASATAPEPEPAAAEPEPAAEAAEAEPAAEAAPVIVRESESEVEERVIEEEAATQVADVTEAAEAETTAEPETPTEDTKDGGQA